MASLSSDEFDIVDETPPSPTRSTASDFVDVAYACADTGDFTVFRGLGALTWADYQPEADPNPGDNDSEIVGRRFQHCETAF